MINILHDVISALFKRNFPGNFSPAALTVEPVGKGLIHRSFKVTVGKSNPIFLQQMNQSVFVSPEKVQENYMLLYEFKNENASDFLMPEPLYFENGMTLFSDSEGNVWRAFAWIAESKTFDLPENPVHVKHTAQKVALFTYTFLAFDTKKLHITIPHFHDLDFRYHQFEEALKDDAAGRLHDAQQLTEMLLSKSRYVKMFRYLTASGACRLRLIHHDAKIGNILFHEKYDTPLCLVDYDTAMPGYFFSDLGDMIRTLCPSADENYVNTDELCIRTEFYRTILDSYLIVMKDIFSETEKKWIHCAGLFMFYIQALRFMTDYLSGDTYYRVEYPEQNLHRAMNQFTLLCRLEKFLKKEYHFEIPEYL
ncbi:MAG: aminoglycoside phosphotransferase family protein [Chitinophagaceae bacterium]|nr:aminoglycoside phosphotransferase family protein [Chitinophagaceae bacterium]